MRPKTDYPYIHEQDPLEARGKGIADGGKAAGGFRAADSPSRQTTGGHILLQRFPFVWIHPHFPQQWQIRGRDLQVGFIDFAQLQSHVALAVHHPHIADDDVVHLDGLAPASNCQLLRGGIGRPGRKSYLPAPLVSPRSRLCLLFTKLDGYLLSGLSPTPDHDGLFALQDHVAGKHAVQLELAGDHPRAIFLCHHAQRQKQPCQASQQHRATYLSISAIHTLWSPSSITLCAWGRRLASRKTGAGGPPPVLLGPVVYFSAPAPPANTRDSLRGTAILASTLP